MAHCEFRVEDKNGKVIHIGDTVKIDMALAEKRHPEDYQYFRGIEYTHKVYGFGYYAPLKYPYLYDKHWTGLYADCCEVIESNQDISFSMEY